MLNSYLYVPGDKPDLFHKADSTAADALILDLEDSVAPAARAEAESAVGEILANTGPRGSGNGEKALVLRVHPDHLASHIRIAVGGGIDLLCLPKAELSTLSSCVDLLTRTEAEFGVDQPLRVAALVESAQGLLDAPAMASHPRVATMSLGEADLFADLGMDTTLSDHDRIGIRTPLVVACASAGLPGPTAPVSTDFRDLDSLRASCEHLKALGYRARSAIHPAQIDAINEVFAPSAAEITAARELVERFDRAVAAGEGVIVGEDGQMIDEAVVRSARRLLS